MALAGTVVVDGFHLSWPVGFLFVATILPRAHSCRWIVFTEPAQCAERYLQTCLAPTDASAKLFSEKSYQQFH
jgi:hypothetical protein